MSHKRLPLIAYCGSLPVTRKNMIDLAVVWSFPTESKFQPQQILSSFFGSNKITCKKDTISSASTAVRSVRHIIWSTQLVFMFSCQTNLLQCLSGHVVWCHLKRFIMWRSVLLNRMSVPAYLIHTPYSFTFYSILVIIIIVSKLFAHNNLSHLIVLALKIYLQFLFTYWHTLYCWLS